MFQNEKPVPKEIRERHLAKDDISECEDEWYKAWPKTDSLDEDGVCLVGTRKEKLPTDCMQVDELTIPSPPSIVVETYRENGRLITGPPGKQSSPELYVDETLDEVVSCPTNREYFYAFLDAHKRPHFVISHEDLKQYMKSIVANVSGTTKLLVLHQKSTLKPIHIGDSNCISFCYYGSPTREYQQYFSKPPLDISFWMDRFDNTTNDYDMDELSAARGDFDSCDLGLSRSGVNHNAVNTQSISSKLICSRPCLINTHLVDEYRSLGEIMDVMQKFADGHIKENGRKLFSNTIRDEKLGSIFREMTGAKICRAEAVTVSRQKLGLAKDVMDGKVNFDSTQRHMYVWTKDSCSPTSS